MCLLICFNHRYPLEKLGDCRRYHAGGFQKPGISKNRYFPHLMINQYSLRSFCYDLYYIFIPIIYVVFDCYFIICSVTAFLHIIWLIQYEPHMLGILLCSFPRNLC